MHPPTRITTTAAVWSPSHVRSGQKTACDCRVSVAMEQVFTCTPLHTNTFSQLHTTVNEVWCDSQPPVSQQSSSLWPSTHVLADQMTLDTLYQPPSNNRLDLSPLCFVWCRCGGGIFISLGWDLFGTTWLPSKFTYCILEPSTISHPQDCQQMVCCLFTVSIKLCIGLRFGWGNMTGPWAPLCTKALLAQGDCRWGRKITSHHSAKAGET